MENKLCSLLLSTVLCATSIVLFVAGSESVVPEPEAISVYQASAIPQASSYHEDLAKTEALPESEAEPENIENAESVVESSSDIDLSVSDINLVARVVMAEAEGESELGKRLVIDVIFNRLESSKFSNTIRGVIYTPNAFTCMDNGRFERCGVSESIKQLIREEYLDRTNSKIYYFRADRYHGFGTPIIREGNHYFSSI